MEGQEISRVPNRMKLICQILILALGVLTARAAGKPNFVPTERLDIRTVFATFTL